MFVFGYRASKLRLPKVADLVHVSEKFPAIQSCSVSLCFHSVSTQDPSVVLRGSELIVTRFAYKTGKSEYFINDQASSIKAVTHLLKSYGIDLDHNRFLILQGEVENIALMKPKGSNAYEEGLLEFLEDIIGTNAYKPMIEQSLLELEDANQESNKKIGALRLLEKEKQSKQALKDEADDFLRKENEVALKKNILLQIKIREVNDAISRLNEESVALAKNFTSISLQLTADEQKLSELTSQDLEFKKKASKFQAELDAKKQLIAEYEKRDIQLAERKKFLKQKMAKLNKASTSEKSQLLEKKTTYDSHVAEIAQKEKDLIRLRNQLEPAEEELAKLRDGLSSKAEKYQHKIDVLSKQLAPLVEQDQLIQANISLIESEITVFEDRLAGGKNYEFLVQELASVQTEMSSKNVELSEALNNIKQIDLDYKTLEKDSKSLEDLQGQLSQKINEGKLKVMDLKAQFSEVSSHSGSKTLHSLMESIPDGIFGRLADLASIDAKYQVAFDSAIGGATENIVVRDTEVAERCVAHLKTHSLGRKTFIVLDKLPALKSNGHYPGTRILDLLEFTEPKFRPAFYHALRDTLIANNLEEANVLAFGSRERYRVVTVEGKVIDKSGAMTGGDSSNTRMNGAAIVKSKGSKGASVASTIRKDLDMAETSLSSLTEQLKESQSLFKECKSRLTILSNSKNQMLTLSTKLTQDLQFMNAQKLEIESQLSELNASKKLSSAEKASFKALQTKLASLSSSKETLLADMTKIQAQIQDQQNFIMDIGGMAFKTQMSLVSGLKEQMDTIQDRINYLNTEIINLELLISKLSNKSNPAESTENLSKEIAELEVEISSNMNAALLVTKAIENLTLELDEFQGGDSSVRKAFESLLKIVKKHKNSLEDLNVAKLEISEKLAQLKDSLRSTNQAFAQLTLHPIGDLSESKLPILSDDELAVYSGKKAFEKLERELRLAEDKVSNTKRPYLGILQEFQELMQKLALASNESDLATTKLIQTQTNYETLKKRRFDEFMAGFQTISLKLKELYQLITLGGNAELELVDSLDPFSEGVLFTVMPPKKSWKNIQHLSGGEKTLSSLALVFALHLYKPTPIYVMDEIDAALDFRNVSIIANYIKEKTKNNAQFIVISLRDNMFELADTLIGIYKVNHCTASVTFNPHSVAVI